MEIAETKVNGIYIISASGRIDADNSINFGESLNSHIDDGKLKLLVNFRDVNYISSSGLRVLIAALKKIKSTDGKLVLTSMQPFVRNVFDISGFTRIFDICETEEDGIDKFSSN